MIQNKLKNAMKVLRGIAAFCKSLGVMSLRPCPEVECSGEG